MERWTEYCKELYNYPVTPDKNLLNNEPGLRDLEQLSMLKEEVEYAVYSLKPGKSPGPDNIPSELLKYGGEETIKILTLLC